MNTRDAVRALIVLLGLGGALPAFAFCGFYVGSADDALVNRATQVVLMREGDRTVLSMRNDYQGPPKAFALVVPVPEVPAQADVRTLDPAVFARVDRLAAPRLVEYWEQDPCPAKAPPRQWGGGGMGSAGSGLGGGAGPRRAAKPLVRVEAAFSVAEYDIVVLSADDSAALDTWLREHDYQLPAGAEAALRPYVAGGMKFFVAKVDPAKVTFDAAGRTLLSPLRVAYRSPDLRLPVRLGLLNAAGPQDLVVHVLARDQRYEVANYPNATIPTNLDLEPKMRAQFPRFYAALFDATLARTPGAVITEYAWQANKCDPCPGPVLAARDLATLGADVLIPGGVKATPSRIRLQTRPPEVRGALSPKVVRRVTRQHQRRLEACVERAQRGALPPAGTALEASFTINRAGRVPDAPEVERRGLESAVEACVQRAVRRMRFPAPADQQPVQVRVQWRPRTLRATQRNDPLNRFVLTRLHARYDREGLGEDLVFRPAKPIAGGREIRAHVPTKLPEPFQSKLGQLPNGPGIGGMGIGLGGFGGQPRGPLEQGARPSPLNAFQARYAIRHPWTGPIRCKSPRRNVWGGPPAGTRRQTHSADGLPPKRAPFTLKRAVVGGMKAVFPPPRAK